MHRLPSSRRSAAGRAVLGLGALALAAAPGFTQAAPPDYETLRYHFDSGQVANTSNVPEILFTEAITVKNARWLRLYFEEVTLSGDVTKGTGSILRVTSTYDAAVQEQNSHHAQQWQNSSAYFNGDTVLVEVFAQPGTGTNRIVLKQIDAGFDPVGTDTICDSDDRVFSNDPRAGRSWPTGCSAWLIDDCAGCLLTAGHCGTGGNNVIEFNVPMSLPNGTQQHPPPEDQYAVDQSSNQGTSGGVGNDYRYFGTFPNSNTGLTAKQAQGATFVLSQPPTFNPNEDIRITGYGTDSGTANQAQQTNAGPWVSSAGTSLQYRTDTTGGNSGSPVIHEPTGLAIGIHTHGGCGGGGSGANLGTGLDNGGLQNLLMSPAGVCSGGGISIVGQLPDELVPGQPTDLTIEAPSAVAGSPTLFWRYDGGAYNQQAMVDIGNNMFQGTLPPATCLDFAEYYFSVDTTDCGPQTLPQNAPTEVYDATIPGELETYCTPKANLVCGPSSVNATGTPSSTNSGPFLITTFPVRENRLGVLVYSDAGRAAIPFQGGTLCVNPQPLRRTVPAMSTSIGLCLDSLSIDMNAFAAGLLGGNPASFLTVPGTVVNAQWWARDSVATGSLLSNGLEYRICE